jgi:putative ATP-dependent endonuclease of OLD family
MILKRIRVKNFRSIREATVEVSGQMAIVGGNGAGKSTILRAIDRFYGQSTNVELDDFFSRRVDEPIEIGLTFTSFNDTEREMFKTRIHGEEMTVIRVFDAGGGRNNGRYYGATSQHLPFHGIRSVEGAQASRTAYNELRITGSIYETLPPVARADQIAPALAEWEAQHSGLCELARDDGQFFGFTNVAKGALQKATAFVLIPAVRDASADAMDARGAVIARLLELVVRSAIQQRREIKDFQARISTEYRELTDPERLTELGGLSDDLTTTLKLFYQDAAVLLRWQPVEEFAVPIPAADVSLNDDGFVGPVDHKGHGLQRALILTLLQHLAKATSVEDVLPLVETPGSIVAAEETTVTEITEAEVAAAPAAPPAHHTLPGLILAIEEPELYQHPTKQRHFAKVLTQLSSGELLGVARQTQIVFATHSALFISMDRFDEVRLARRIKEPDQQHKECRLTYSTLADVARRLEVAYGHDEGTFTADGLRARLHVINAEIAEGFFADLVVLVEGASDRAAIMAAAALAQVDLESLGIAVLDVDGKNNLDKPLAIFSSLEIPVFLIWDCDRKPDGAIGHLDQNRALQRLAGVSQENVMDAATVIATSYACFETKLEDIIRNEIGAAVYQAQLERVKELFGIQQGKDVQKAPFAMRELLSGAAAAGHSSQTLSLIVETIVDLRCDSPEPADETISEATE